MTVGTTKLDDIVFSLQRFRQRAPTFSGARSNNGSTSFSQWRPDLRFPLAASLRDLARLTWLHLAGPLRAHQWSERDTPSARVPCARSHIPSVWAVKSWGGSSGGNDRDVI